jgi:hypothetical protein
MGRPPGNKSIRTLAPLIGVSKSGLHRAQQHVEFAERYPWLQAFTQSPVLRIRRAIRTIAPEESDVMMALLELYCDSQTAAAIARVAACWCALSKGERRELYERYLLKEKTP